MIKTTFRATISDTDLDWIQDYKEEHDLKNNAEVIHHLMKLAEENEKNSKWTKDLSDIRKQQRFTKEQVAILTEMVSEFLECKLSEMELMQKFINLQREK